MVDLTLVCGGKKTAIIDCDLEARVPLDITNLGIELTINKHKKHGRISYHPSELEQYVFANGVRIWVPWNVCALFYLLSNKDAIPGWVKGKYIVFGGTSYLTDKNEVVYLGLYWNNYQEDWSVTIVPETVGKGNSTNIMARKNVISSQDLRYTTNNRKAGKRPRLRIIKMEGPERTG